MNEIQAKDLRAPFKPEQIGQIPKGGTMLDYVGHAAVTDRLLQIDPEWTWRPCTPAENAGLPQYDGGFWMMLTVCGVTRPGFGDGKNAKEMISDGIRNAAMRFGVALDLWSKQPLLDETGGNEVPETTRRSAPSATPHPADGAAPRERREALYHRVQDLGLAGWLQAQHYPTPWEPDVCDAIEARCMSEPTP